MHLKSSILFFAGALLATSCGGPSTVRIDVFFIGEKHSNTILFAGKMLNTAAE